MKATKYLIPLNLQLFSDGGGTNAEQPTAASGAFDPEDWADVLAADTDTDVEDKPDDVEVEKDVKPDAKDTEPAAADADHVEDATDGGKPAQSKEDNARFAEQRRQRELQERLQQTPEYQALATLASMYGQTPEQMVQAIKDMQLQQRAQEQNVPVEVVKQMQTLEDRVKAQENDTLTYKYKVWEARIAEETKALLDPERPVKLSFLTGEDIEAAKVAMLQDFKNPDMPLEQAVYALHGPKITKALAEGAHQEALARQANRIKKAPVPPAGTKGAELTTLTDAEKRTAAMFGMSEADYLKAKTLYK